MTHTIDELHQMQSLSLQSKVSMTRDRIRAWIREYGENGVYCSFSGGKDSTVLLDIIRNDMGEKDIPAVFVDVPTQFPELRDFAQTYDNTIIIRPRLSFMQVCDKYGFPLISKEVSECVSGAKKYLTSVQAEIESLQTDRQTDRQLPYAQFYRKVCGLGEYSRMRRIRKLNGTRSGQEKRQLQTDGNSVGNVHEELSLQSEGEYP